MNPQERRDLVRKSLKELLEKIKEGSSLVYLMLSEKNSKKYLQCTISKDQQIVLIDIPESTLTDEEIKKIKAIVSEITGEEALVGLQIQTPIDEAIDTIDRIFIEGFGFNEDYDLEASILE